MNYDCLRYFSVFKCYLIYFCSCVFKYVGLLFFLSMVGSKFLRFGLIMLLVFKLVEFMYEELVVVIDNFSLVKKIG